MRGCFNFLSHPVHGGTIWKDCPYVSRLSPAPSPSSVLWCVADIAVHHPSGGHYLGALGHGWTAGTWCQVQRGHGGHWVLSVLSQLGPGQAQQPQQDCTEQHIPVYTSQTEEFQLPCPLEAPTKAQGVCAHVQCLMATPPRGWLSPAEPQRIGMTQLQFWVPTKEVQGSVWAQFISRSALASGHHTPPLQEQFCGGFQERRMCLFHGAGSAGFSPSPTEPDVRLDHVSNFQVP